MLGWVIVGWIAFFKVSLLWVGVLHLEEGIAKAPRNMFGFY